MREEEKTGYVGYSCSNDRPPSPMSITMDHENSKMLRSLIPEFDNLIRRNSDIVIGSNDFCYDQDGWYIEFDFDFNVGAFSSRGKVWNLSVQYWNEAKNEETVFPEEDILEFRKEIESILGDLI